MAYIILIRCEHTLLKIHLNEIKVSLLEIRGWNLSSFHPPTIFDFHYGDDCFDLIFKTLCQVVDKKAFVDCFKQYSRDGSQKRLHAFIFFGSVELIKSYLGVFLDYAKNCPEKSKEVLDVLKAKNCRGRTALAFARKQGKTEIAAVIEDTIKELKRNLQRKEKCLVQ